MDQDEYKDEKVSLCFFCLIPSIFFVGIAYGQSDFNPIFYRFVGSNQLQSIDNFLDIPVPATLAGIAIIAGNFLVAYKPHDKHILRIKSAARDFFRAFFVLLICTVLILLLNVIEVFLTQAMIVEFIDIIIKYVLFGIGLVYLFKGSRNVMEAITESNEATKSNL